MDGLEYKIDGRCREPNADGYRKGRFRGGLNTQSEATSHRMQSLWKRLIGKILAIGWASCWAKHQ